MVVIDKLESIDVTVDNSGLVLFEPYYPMIFYRLGLLDDSRRLFKSEEAQMHAIFLLQYLLYSEEREYEESELFLNRILVNLPFSVSIPRSVMLSEDQKRMANGLMESAIRSWDKLRNTPIEGIKDSFLKREGRITCQTNDGNRWNIVVKEMALDMLLDSVPWSFRMVKYPWMENPLIVKWR